MSVYMCCMIQLPLRALLLCYQWWHLQAEERPEGDARPEEEQMGMENDEVEGPQAGQADAESEQAEETEEPEPTGRPFRQLLFAECFAQQKN